MSNYISLTLYIPFKIKICEFILKYEKSKYTYRSIYIKMRPRHILAHMELFYHAKN